MTYSDTQVDLVINKLTREQYEALKASGQISQNELYLLTDSDEVHGDARLLPEYLHAIDFDSSYPDDAAWYYSQMTGIGGCSARRVSGTVERNYDWNFDDSAEFIVKMSKGPSRFASIGVASVGQHLKESDVNSGKWSRWFKCLPGATLDGINEYGVVAEINVVPANGAEWETQTSTRDLNAVGAVRYVLDNAQTAAQGAAYIAAHVYIPEAMKRMGYSAHYMIADASETWIVEDGVAYSTEVEGIPNVMTNFRVLSADEFGTGYERYQLLSSSASDITDAWFTKAYEKEQAWPWPTEFAGSEDGEGKIPHTATERLQAWADAHVIPVLPVERNKQFWQTVHTSKYDIANKTLTIAVQEKDDWYSFQIPAAGSGGGSVDPRVDQLVIDMHDVKITKADLSAVPTATSDLENDSGFATSAYVNEKVEDATEDLSATVEAEYAKLSAIPTVNNSRITFVMDGTNRGSFTLNQNLNANINLSSDVTKEDLREVSADTLRDAKYFTQTNFLPLSGGTIQSQGMHFGQLPKTYVDPGKIMMTSGSNSDVGPEEKMLLSSDRIVRILDQSEDEHQVSVEFEFPEAGGTLATEAFATAGAIGAFHDAQEYTDSQIAQIPTPSNAQIVIKQGNVEKGSFTLNQTLSGVINLDAGSSGGANWGQIGGELSDQTDLKNALDGKTTEDFVRTVAQSTFNDAKDYTDDKVAQATSGLATEQFARTEAENAKNEAIGYTEDALTAYATASDAMGYAAEAKADANAYTDAALETAVSAVTIELNKKAAKTDLDSYVAKVDINNYLSVKLDVKEFETEISAYAPKSNPEFSGDVKINSWDNLIDRNGVSLEGRLGDFLTESEAERDYAKLSALNEYALSADVDAKIDEVVGSINSVLDAINGEII